MFPNADPAYAKPRVMVANPYDRPRNMASGDTTARGLAADPYDHPHMVAWMAMLRSQLNKVGRLSPLRMLIAADWR